LARTLVVLLARLLFRVRVEGREHLPRYGGYIVAATHRSWVDAFLLESALPLEPRPHFLGDREEMMATRFRRIMLGLFGGVIPISRGKRVGDDAAITAAVRVVQGGGVLGIFPEGRVAAEEGEMLPVQRGVAHVALRTGAAIVPAAISGHKELYLRKPITVRFGPAFTPAPGDGTLPARVRAVTNQVQEAMLAQVRPYQQPPASRKWLRNLLTDLF
ncbi:MAG: lysophospholipid acyltransferase family protein, partial [Chloroflexi bacterium]|nr:lysophospholipid acyltransferase family protein [Chloroflexota bacterium]